MIVARVVNAAGRAFNVRLVQEGDRYGRDDGLVHAATDPFVEFWDATYEQDLRCSPGLGQFVARYYLSALLREAPRRGLDLCGHEPAWKVTTGNVADALAAAEAAIARTATRGCT